MKILIIGGTGLISTPLTQKLLERGDDVTLFNRGSKSALDGARHIVGDRTAAPDFAAKLRAAGRFDCVIDMVGYAPADGEQLAQNFAGQTAQLVFCSTVDVYAKPASRYPTRPDEPYGPLNDYAPGKVAIKRTLVQAAQNGAFALTILRPAHTCGDNGALIHAWGDSVWIDRLRQNLPLIVHGDGTSLWTQAHAENVAAAFVGAAGNAQTYSRKYTVTNEEAFEWNALFEIAAAFGSHSDRRFGGVGARMVGQFERQLLESQSLRHLRYARRFGLSNHDSAARRRAPVFRESGLE